jgi:protein phosphatase
MNSFSSGDYAGLLVTDGMGGHEGGEIAAELVAAAVPQYLQDLNGVDPRVALDGAFRFADHQVRANQAVDPALARMGATLVLALIRGEELWIAHVGDSRGYLVRNGRLIRLTEDDTLANRLHKAGQITAAEARIHPGANVLVRALGHGEDASPSLDGPIALLRGDALILCSDGLSGCVPDPEIARVLTRNRGPHVAQCLAAAAAAAGSQDNITVLYAEWP